MDYNTKETLITGLVCSVLTMAVIGITIFSLSYLQGNLDSIKNRGNHNFSQQENYSVASVSQSVNLATHASNNDDIQANSEEVFVDYSDDFAFVAMADESVIVADIGEQNETPIIEPLSQTTVEPTEPTSTPIELTPIEPLKFENNPISYYSGTSIPDFGAIYNYSIDPTSGNTTNSSGAIISINFQYTRYYDDDWHTTVKKNNFDFYNSHHNFTHSDVNDYMAIFENEGWTKKTSSKRNDAILQSEFQIDGATVYVGLLKGIMTEMLFIEIYNASPTTPTTPTTPQTPTTPVQPPVTPPIVTPPTTEKVQCLPCNGTGRVACHNCNGSTYNPYSSGVCMFCYNAWPKGTADCKSCNGTGWR